MTQAFLDQQANIAEKARLHELRVERCAREQATPDVLAWIEQATETKLVLQADWWRREASWRDEFGGNWHAYHRDLNFAARADKRYDEAIGMERLLRRAYQQRRAEMAVAA